MSELDVLEPEAFAKYCGNDADACWQLYEQLTYIAEKYEWFDTLMQWLDRFMLEIRLLIEQQSRGICIKSMQLNAYSTALTMDIAKAKENFLNDEAVVQLAAELKLEAVEAVLAKPAPRTDLWRKHLDREPPKYKKDLTLSKRWELWYHRWQEIKKDPQYNVAWLRWHERYLQVQETEVFNLNSLDQLKRLFFTQLKHKPTKFTATGEPGLDNKALRFVGPLGKLLLKYREDQKELGYVTACIEHTRNGVLHHVLKPHGTVTGRLAGGKDK